jgi:RNA polymerase sigma-70 factor (ECF subfamily)
MMIGPGFARKIARYRQNGPPGRSFKKDEQARLRELEELYDRHGEGLYRYLLFKLGSAEDAEDALQEAFCRFARYDLRWKAVRNVRAFVFRVARNEANRSLRRKLGRREGERVIASGAAERMGVAFVAPDGPALGLLLRRAGELPAEQREAVYLKVFDGLTFKEIGAVCGVSANTAASRYRYGIEKLRNALGSGS